MTVTGFEEPWAHVRLLADERRTEALVELLRRRAPGGRVLEVGTGTGLLACVAARLGAEHVYAVEVTELADVARELVDRAGLRSKVTVIEGDIIDIAPREVDLVFSELLNADPFAEGIVESMMAAHSWLAEGGVMAPGSLRVFVALVENLEGQEEIRRMEAGLDRLGRELDLPTGWLHQICTPPTVDFDLAPQVSPISEGTLALDVDLATGRGYEDALSVVTTPQIDGRAGGAVVWFEAPLIDELVLTNRPGQPGHWGHLIANWHQAIEIRAGEPLELLLSFVDGEVDLVPAGWGR